MRWVGMQLELAQEVERPELFLIFVLKTKNEKNINQPVLPTRNAK